MFYQIDLIFLTVVGPFPFKLYSQSKYHSLKLKQINSKCIISTIIVIIKY